MERRDGDKHDRVGERGEDVFDNYCQKVPCLYTIFRKYHDDCLCRTSCDQSTDKGPAPNMNWWIGGRPASSIVTETYFKGEVDENSKGQIFLAETLVNELEVRNSIIGLEADLGDEMNYDDTLNISEFQNAEHTFVDFHNAVALLGLIFTLQ